MASKGAGRALVSAALVNENGSFGVDDPGAFCYP